MYLKYLVTFLLLNIYFYCITIKTSSTFLVLNYFLKDLIIVYFKGRVPGGEKEIFICWYATQRAAMARAGPGRDQESRASSGSPTGLQEPKDLAHPSSTTFLGALMGSEFRFGPLSKWDPCTVGNGFTHCATTSALI